MQTMHASCCTTTQKCFQLRISLTLFVGTFERVGYTLKHYNMEMFIWLTMLSIISAGK